MLISKKIDQVSYLYDSSTCQLYSGNDSGIYKLFNNLSKKNQIRDAKHQKKNKSNKPIRVGLLVDGIQIPPVTGVPYRFYYLSHELHKRGIEVVVFLCDRCNVGEAKLRKEPFEIHTLSSSIMYQDYESLKEIVSNAGVDILQVDHSQTALWYGTQLSEDLCLPLITEMHDIDANVKKTMGADEGEVRKQLFIQYAAGILSDKVICVAESDYAQLLELGIESNKIEVIPNGINTVEMSFKKPNINSETVIFLGNMYYPPNKHAAELLITKVMPFISKKLICVGMADKEFIKKYQSNKVHFTGAIDDFREHVWNSALAIAPIFQGSGMKVKMLNFAALGIPIITTDEGVAGYPKEIAFVENDINEYPKKINSIFSNESLYLQQSQQARKLIEEHFSWNSIVNRVIEIYSNIKYSPKRNVLGLDISLTDSLAPTVNSKEHVPYPLWLEDEARVKKNSKTDKLEYSFVKGISR